MPDSDIGIPLQSHADPARTTSHGEQALVAQDIAPVLPFENIAAARPALREEKDDSPFYATSGSPKTSGRTASADRPSYDKSPHAGAPDVEQQVEGGPKRELDIEHIEGSSELFNAVMSRS